MKGTSFSSYIPLTTSRGLRTPEFGKAEGRTADPSASLGMTILFGNAKYRIQDELSSRAKPRDLRCALRISQTLNNEFHFSAQLFQAAVRRQSGICDIGRSAHRCRRGNRQPEKPGPAGVRQSP